MSVINRPGPTRLGPTITLFDVLFLSHLRRYNILTLTQACYWCQYCCSKFWFNSFNWLANYKVFRKAGYSSQFHKLMRTTHEPHTIFKKHYIFFIWKKVFIRYKFDFWVESTVFHEFFFQNGSGRSKYRSFKQFELIYQVFTKKKNV